MQQVTDLSFLQGSAPDVAPRLLGLILQRQIGEQVLSARIVEVEAYNQADAASHSFNGVTPRTQVMFGPAGFLYVYFTYGMHFCCNIVVGKIGEGAAVLIRAVEPVSGHHEMTHRRQGRAGIELTNGPAKLCQALGIDAQLNGHNLTQQPLLLIPSATLPAAQIVVTTRVGISQGKDTAWRFYIKDNLYVSKK